MIFFLIMYYCHFNDKVITSGNISISYHVCKTTFIVLFLFLKIADRCQEQLAQASTLDAADRRAAVVYADTLTILFEDVGKVVEIHQPLVETYYGK